MKKENKLPEKVVVDSYHGYNIEDPYRYVEDLKHPDIINWMNTQTSISKNKLEEIDKRSFLIEQLQSFDKKKKFEISRIKISDNDRYFYLKRLPEDNVPRLYYRDSFHGEEYLLYDVKDFKIGEKKSTYVINYIQPSWDGSTIVISISSGGKEISELVILDVATGEVYPHVLTNAKPNNGGIKWLPDNSGFIFLRYPITNPDETDYGYNTESVLYLVKKDSSGEDLVTTFSKKNNPNLGIKEEDFPKIEIENSSSAYLIGKISGAGSFYDTYYLEAKDIFSNQWKPLFKKTEQIKSFVINGDSIIYRTAKGASNYKICATSVKTPDFNNPKVLVEELDDEVISDFDVTNESLYFVTSKNGVKARLFQLKEEEIKEIEFPVSYGNISIKAKGSAYPELWVSVRGWTTKSSRYEYKEGTLLERNLNTGFKYDGLEDIVVEEIEVQGHDGEKIPLSIIYNKKVEKNGKNRLLMDGYGAYGISTSPYFSMQRLLWVLEGGIYVNAHVRGGGEKGDAWHKGGYKETKPNTWKDFISCAEYLIKEKYTNSEQLAVWSGSAGGILIGRAITERPDLFGTAIVEFGSLNMLRLEAGFNGKNNVKEFGSVRDSLGFRGLLEMDAYHHIKDKEKYPATLLTAGLNDPRVPAWNSVKFSARIQAANTSDSPNFLLIDSEAGHAKDDTKIKEFERYANILAFALWQTGHPEYQPKQKVKG